MELIELAEQPPTVLDALPADVLMNLQTQAEQYAAEGSKMLAILHGVMERRYARGINQTGTTHVTDGDIDITVTIPNRIKYDQAALATAVETIRSWGEDPAEYVQTEIKVSEHAYNAWPSAVRDLFTPARTVKAGKAKFVLAPKKREAA
jgi:hypothetical protein